MLKTNSVNNPSVIFQLGIVLNIVILAAVVYFLRLLWVRVALLEEERLGVSLGRAPEKAVSYGAVSPKLAAVISGAVAAYLDDKEMEHHKITSITPVPR